MRISIFVGKKQKKNDKIFGERVVDEDFNLCSQKQKKSDKNLGRKGCGWGSQSLFPKILLWIVFTQCNVNFNKFMGTVILLVNVKVSSSKDCNTIPLHFMVTLENRSLMHNW